MSGETTGLVVVMASQHFGRTLVLKPWNAKTAIGISQTHMCIRSIMCAGGTVEQYGLVSPLALVNASFKIVPEGILCTLHI